MGDRGEDMGQMTTGQGPNPGHCVQDCAYTVRAPVQYLIKLLTCTPSMSSWWRCIPRPFPGASCSPFLYHVTSGSGRPLASQRSEMVAPTWGSSTSDSDSTRGFRVGSTVGAAERRGVRGVTGRKPTRYNYTHSTRRFLFMFYRRLFQET